MEYSSFENEQINTLDLPDHSKVEFEALEQKHLQANLISTTIVSLIFLAIAFGVSFISEGIGKYLIYAIAIIVFLALLIISLEILGFKFKGYAIREKDISYKSGVIFRDTVILPFNRVQHCEINEGPIDRRFGLASIKIFTAGGSSSDLEIPGLSKAKAELIKGFIIRKTVVDEEE